MCSSPDTKSAFVQGYQACMKGIFYDENPYEEESMDHWQWEDGWIMAREQMEA